MLGVGGALIENYFWEKDSPRFQIKNQMKLMISCLLLILLFFVYVVDIVTIHCQKEAFLDALASLESIIWHDWQKFTFFSKSVSHTFSVIDVIDVIDVSPVSPVSPVRLAHLWVDIRVI